MDLKIENNEWDKFYFEELMQPENFWWLNLKLKTEGVAPFKWYINNKEIKMKDLISFMEDYREGLIKEVPESHYLLMTSLYILYKSEIRIEEISNMELSWEKLEYILSKKIEFFISYINEFNIEDYEKLNLIEQVQILPILRKRVEKEKAIYRNIEANSLRRWETIYDPRLLTLNDIPSHIIKDISDFLDFDIKDYKTDNYKEFFEEMTRLFIERKENALPLLEILTRNLLYDKEIEGGDFSLLVGPRMINTKEPWTMTNDKDFFCIVVAHPDYNPQEYGLKIKTNAIQRMVATRMFVNKIHGAHFYNPDDKVKYAKSVGHLGAPDKSVNEHINQKGHAAAGVRASVRSPIAINMTCDGSVKKFTGISDTRIARTSNQPFSEKALFRTITYSKWMTQVFETTFLLNKKLTDINADKNISFFSRNNKVSW